MSSIQTLGGSGFFGAAPEVIWVSSDHAASAGAGQTALAALILYRQV